MASLQKSEDLEDDRRTSAIRPEAPALLDRAVFAGTDPGTAKSRASWLQLMGWYSQVMILQQVNNEQEQEEIT